MIKDIQETLEVDIPVILMGTYPELLSAARIKLGLPADNIMLKPFDTFRFEQRCCELLGLRSKVLAAIAQEWK